MIVYSSVLPLFFIYHHGCHILNFFFREFIKGKGQNHLNGDKKGRTAEVTLMSLKENKNLILTVINNTFFLIFSYISHQN